MPRYIDAEKLKLSIIGLRENSRSLTLLFKQFPQPCSESARYETLTWALNVCEHLLDCEPTADVKEVRHGEWKTTVSTVLHNNGEQSTYYGCRCTVCKEDADKSFLFCPNCGAHMDG